MSIRRRSLIIGAAAATLAVPAIAGAWSTSSNAKVDCVHHVDPVTGIDTPDGLLTVTFQNQEKTDAIVAWPLLNGVPNAVKTTVPAGRKQVWNITVPANFAGGNVSVDETWVNHPGHDTTTPIVVPALTGCTPIPTTTTQIVEVPVVQTVTQTVEVPVVQTVIKTVTKTTPGRVRVHRYCPLRARGGGVRVVTIRRGGITHIYVICLPKPRKHIPVTG